MQRIRMMGAAFSAILAAAALWAGDWPGWRGPNRDGVAPQSPPLVDEFPKDGPKKVWESEAIPGGHNGGFAQPTVAEGKIFVFYNCRFEKPIETRILRRGELTELGWMPGVPDDLAKAMEDARASEARAALKDNNAIGAWADAWIKDNLKSDQRKFQYVVKKRLTLGAQALPLETLAKLEPIADKEFAGQGELDAWLKQHDIDPAAQKPIMARIPTKVNACNDVLFCLDREKGQTQWKQELTGNWMWYAASSTPAVSGGRLWFLGSGAVAHCLNTADGSVVWQSKPLGAAQHSHNRSSSPLLVDNRLIVGSDTATWALDPATGQTLWKATDEKGNAIVNKEASAVTCTVAGKPLILYSSASDKPLTAPDCGKIFALDPETGKAAWSVPAGLTGSTSAVAGDAFAFMSWTPEVGVTAYRLTTPQPTKLWSVPIKEGYSSPIVWQGFVYAVGGANATFGDNGKGRALCIEVATGRVAWNELIGPGLELSSPVLADGKLLFSAGGWLYLVKASPAKYELLGKANLGLAPYASPAFADGFLFVRTNKNVVCYDLRK